MVTFLFGNIGSGKSTYIFEKIKEDAKAGTRALLIVPEQQTVFCEREIADKLPPSAQLLCEAVNFTRLSNKIFRQYGGLKYNYITSSAKNLIMYRTICEVRSLLKTYKIPVGREKSLVKLFLDTIGELKSYGNTPKMLEEVIEKCENERLASRLFDIALVYSTYERILSEKYSDPSDDIIMLEKKLSVIDYFKGYNVYIDSFYGFTKSQEDVIRHIIRQAENVTFALDCPINYDKTGVQYAKISETAKKLKGIVSKLKKEYKEIAFENDYKHKNEALKYLCDNIWNFSSKPITYSDGINLVLADDEFKEAEFVSAKIKELILNGAKYSDIAIIARNVATYYGIIDVSLSKYDIPYFMSQKTNITSKPVIKMILSAIRAISSYRAEDIISYLKCGYSDIDEKAIDEFESYIFRWNIYGRKFSDDDFWVSNPDGYVSKTTEAQLATLASIIETRDAILSKLSTLHNVFSKKSTVAECSLALFNFLCEHKVKEKIEEEMKTVSEAEAYELSQLWNMVIKSLDTLVENMGNETVVDASSYETLLKYVFDNETIGTIPTGEDNVTIGDASLIRAGNIKHVFIMGVNEGSFPANVQDNGFFSDSDKVSLETYGIILSSSNDVRADDELMFFKNALACASLSATVSCLKKDMGATDKKEPSIAFRRIATLLDGIKIIDTSLMKTEDFIYSEKSAKEYFSLLSSGAKKALEETLKIEAPSDEPFSNEEIYIDKDFINKTFGKDIVSSQAKIDTFVNCKFKYYCSYVLGLKAQSVFSFSSLNVGNLTHEVFEKFLVRAKAEKIDFSCVSNEEIERIFDEVADKCIEEISKSSFQSTKLKHLFKRLRGNLLVYIKNFAMEFSETKFSAEYFELPFFENRAGSLKPLKFKIDDDASISLNGVADRVDVYKKGNDTYIRIVDYKSGNKVFSREAIKQGTEIQMPVYLFTLSKMADSAFRKALVKDGAEIIPAGIMYIPLNIGKVQLPLEADVLSSEAKQIEEKAISESIKRNGYFLYDEEILKAQDPLFPEQNKFLPGYSRNKTSYVGKEEFESLYEELEAVIGNIGKEILSGNASALPNPLLKSDPCAHCDHKAVCRRRQK